MTFDVCKSRAGARRRADDRREDVLKRPTPKTKIYYLGEGIFQMMFC